MKKIYLLWLITIITLWVSYGSYITVYTNILDSLNYLRWAWDIWHIGYIITEMFNSWWLNNWKIKQEYLELPSWIAVENATTSVTWIVMLEENTWSILTTKSPTSRILTQVWNNLNTRINSLVSTALTIETDPVWISASWSYYTKTQVDSNLALKAPIASPTLTWSPKSNEVLNANDNDSSLATTAFVQNTVSAASATSGITFSNCSTTDKKQIYYECDISNSACFTAWAYCWWWKVAWSVWWSLIVSALSDEWMSNRGYSNTSYGNMNPATQVCWEKWSFGFDDRQLPNKNELNLLYTNRSAIWGFSTNDYWSSTENTYYNAWYQNFIDGSQSRNNKDATFYIRCIRKF